jgi:hypothetical protein
MHADIQEIFYGVYVYLLPQSMPGREANNESLRETMYDIEMCTPSRRSPAAYE